MAEWSKAVVLGSSPQGLGCEAHRTAGPGLLVVKKDAQSVLLEASDLKIVNTASKLWPSGGATAYHSPITIIAVRQNA